MVDYQVDRNLGILTVNNPPVNALSHHVRVGLVNGIKEANADKQVAAIIICGNGETFPCGADIKEFNSGAALKDPSISAVVSFIESSDKPVISAIHGTALGGGLEIALGSHYRIANENARIGFPEVLIGLTPAAQGSVRLSRLSGLGFAMDMIASGRQVHAKEGFRHCVLDKLCAGNVLEAAKAFANQVIGQPLDSKRLSNIPVKDAANVDVLFEDALAQVKKKYKGQFAPINCLKAVRNSAKMSFENAVAEEIRLVMELKTGGQAAALQYSFFADRSAPKWSLPSGSSVANSRPAAIKTAGVIGAGTMGSGIAICLIRAGIPVILVEKNHEMLEKAMKTISTILEGSVKLKRMTPQQKVKCLGILKGASGLNKLSDLDLVIEAVYENLELKRKIFAELDAVCKPATLLCSNTSTLDIDKIASATNRPDKVIGTHFFSPAYIMRLLENVYGSKTSPTTIASVMELGRRIGKISVLVKTCYGFVANRTYHCLSAEADFMLEEGALPQDIDKVLEDFGMHMGPFKVMDLAGLDVGWSIRQEVAKSLGLRLTTDTRYLHGERVSTVADSLYELGRYGIKTAKGWYNYPSSTRKPVPDSDVADLILRHSDRMGFQRRNIPPQEVIERCFFAVINEAFRALEERVAEKPEDIDVIWQHGFSFPRHAGGPMFYASQVGLKRVFEKVCFYHEKFPYSSHWVPSDLLRKLASHTVEVPIAKWTQFMTGSKL